MIKTETAPRQVEYIVDDFNIDLLGILRTLLNNAVIIVLAGVICAAASLTVSTFMTPIFEASSIIVVTKPRYQFNFDENIQLVDNIQYAYKAYPTLATSDRVVSLVHESFTTLPSDIKRASDLGELLSAKNGSDPSLIMLTVRHKDPGFAASVADRWASIFINVANEIYSDQGATQLTYLENSLEEAAYNLDLAEQALVDFRAIDRSSIVQNQLTAELKAQADYLAQEQSLTNLIDSVDGLVNQFERSRDSATSTMADQLTALLLQVRGYNLQGINLPLQLQIDSQSTLTQADRAEQVALLRDLHVILEEQITNVKTQTAASDPTILLLQQELQQLTTEFDRLQREYDLAKETYLTLSRKVQEARISNQGTGDARIASQPDIPTEPVYPRKLLNTAIGGLAGVFLAGAFVLLRAQFRDQQQPDAE